MSLVWMQNHTLISLVRAERALWDSAYSGYRDADARNEAWERVISGLGLSSLSQSQMIMIIRRWRNLRDTFARKHKCAMKKGDAAAVRASSRWKHYNSLMFLQDVLEPRRRTRRTKATEQDMKSASSIKQEHEDPGESSASQLLATVSGNVATSPSDTDTPVTHYTIQTMPASPSSSSSSAEKLGVHLLHLFCPPLNLPLLTFHSHILSHATPSPSGLEQRENEVMQMHV
ncbi:hypothetical protein V5799_001308 [Amblyomma americanum]|uniref:MADF domain-containing protein n=1 Tax=Amblyomma americanum TaxID=6943 RepID=A0AAQ4D0K2_AMBAM